MEKQNKTEANQYAAHYACTASQCTPSFPKQKKKNVGCQKWPASPKTFWVLLQTAVCINFGRGFVRQCACTPPTVDARAAQSLTSTRAYMRAHRGDLGERRSSTRASQRVPLVLTSHTATPPWKADLGLLGQSSAGSILRLQDEKKEGWGGGSSFGRL